MNNRPIKAKTLFGLFRNHPERWIKGCTAKTSKKGRVTCYTSVDAHCFCLSGAINRLYPIPDKWKEVTQKLQQVIGELFPPYTQNELFAGDIIAFNDSRKTTFKDIMKVIKKAKV
jgi:hypothetical protein